MPTKVLAVIPARQGSSRLRGKTLAPVAGKPMIERKLERVARSKYIQKIVIATTQQSEDDELVTFASNWGCEVFRGSESDVLDRIAKAAAAFEPEIIVKLLGDNPLVHSELIDDTMDLYLQGNFDLVANATKEYIFVPKSMPLFPVGLRVQVIRPDALYKSAELAREPKHREHAPSFIYENPELFRVGYLAAEAKWRDLAHGDMTFAVNVPKNLELVCRIFERCLPKNDNFSLVDVMREMEKDPSLPQLMGNDA